MAQLTSKDLWRIWQDLDLRGWDEREVVDRLDTYCVESAYTYHIPEGTIYLSAMDVLPDSYHEEVQCAELETPDGVYDMTNTLNATQTTNHLRLLGWKETHGSDGELVLVRFSDPRIGYKPADGTLIIGYHEHPQKVYTYTDIKKIIDK